jgi:hypothetical protein
MTALCHRATKSVAAQQPATAAALLYIILCYGEKAQKKTFVYDATGLITFEE